MVDLEKLLKKYEDAVDAANAELVREVKTFEAIVIPQGTGALLASYHNAADQGRVASNLPYADEVEDAVGRTWRNPGAMDQAAQKTMEFAEEIGPRLLEFNLREKELIE